MDVAELSVRRLFVGGAKGIDEWAESLGKDYGMNVDVILNPQHPRAKFVTPLTNQQTIEALLTFTRPTKLCKDI